MVGNTPFLPLKVTQKVGSRGPAPPHSDPDARDIVDESLDLFKSNIFFTTYEVKENADRVLIYCTLYIVYCLQTLAKSPNKAQAVQDMYALALQRFSLPGEAGFPLNPFYEKPKTSGETEELRKYFTQLRQEVGARLIERVFDESLTGGEDKPSKWWICFARKKFLNVSLSK